MIVDNCPAHPHVKGLKSVKLVFLPPNTTSVIQPMDQGVIRNYTIDSFSYSTIPWVRILSIS